MSVPTLEHQLTFVAILIFRVRLLHLLLIFILMSTKSIDVEPPSILPKSFLNTVSLTVFLPALDMCRLNWLGFTRSIVGARRPVLRGATETSLNLNLLLRTLTYK